MARNKTKTPKERQVAYEKAHEALLKKHDLGFTQIIEFPFSRKVPILSRIALKIVAMQGGRFGIRYVDLTK